MAGTTEVAELRSGSLGGFFRDVMDTECGDACGFAGEF